VVRALHTTGRTDIGLVSFGDFATADLLRPAVTVIDHDPRVLARKAMERLSSRMDGAPDDDEDFVVPLHLIMRGSGELHPAESGSGGHRSTPRARATAGVTR